MTRRLAAWGALATAAGVAAAVIGLPAPAYTHNPITTNILFKNEIAQIFQRKCFQCHSENNLAMSLTTYTDARPWARAIREEILDREMPPWTAVTGYGHFANDISLNTRERDIILSWADGGAPSGVPKAEEPIPPVWVPPAPSWDHGPPDQVVPVGTGHLVDAYAPFAIQRFVVATNFSAPTRVHALALKQGDRRVVRHAAFYEEASGRWLGSWTPWQTVSDLPPGFAHRLPAKARIVVEIGYAGAEQAVTDTSELGLYLDKGAGVTVSGQVIRTPDAPLAAAASAQRLRAELTLTADTTLLALWPDPSAGATSIELTARTAAGATIPLLWVKDYRAEWRSGYVLSEPLPLARGTRVVMTTYFDNPTDQAAVARAQAWLMTAPPPESDDRPPKR